MRSIAALSIIALTAAAFGQATTAPAQGLSPVRTVHLKPITLMYTEQHVARADAANVIHQSLHDLAQALIDQKISAQGPAVLVYPHASPDPSAKMDVQIGLPVPDGTPPNDQYQVRQLDADRSATALYTGDIDSVAPAVSKFFDTMIRAGDQPTGELRIRILYFESPSSPNDVMLLEVPVR